MNKIIIIKLLFLTHCKIWGQIPFKREGMMEYAPTILIKE